MAGSLGNPIAGEGAAPACVSWPSQDIAVQSVMQSINRKDLKRTLEQYQDAFRVVFASGAAEGLAADVFGPSFRGEKR